MQKQNYKTLEELEDKYIGKADTSAREDYEFELSMEILGEKIKELRKKRNLTQEELGSFVGVQKAQISRLERGKSSATLSSINKVLRAMRAKAMFRIEYD